MTLDPKLLQHLHDSGCMVWPCGSRVTCDPPPTDTDVDYLVQCPNTKVAMSDLVDLLESWEFAWEGEKHYQEMAGDNSFISFRNNGQVNLIVTKDQRFVRNHRAATAVCKALNLMDKPTRIKIFQTLLYSDWEKCSTP